MTEHSEKSSNLAEDYRNICSALHKELVSANPANAIAFCTEYFQNLTKIDESETMNEEDIRRNLDLCAQDRRTSIRAQSINPEECLAKIKSMNLEEKPAEMRAMLLDQFKTIFFMSNLDTQALNMIADAMEPRLVKKNEIIINEGEKGDFFYVIEHGTYSVMQKNKEKKSVEICKLENKGYFGELSLLYDSPRNATIKVISDEGKLWKLDSHSFKAFMCKVDYDARTKKLDQLKQMRLFSQFSYKELDTLTDAMKYVEIKGRGTPIFLQGDEPDGLYFIVKGSVQCQKMEEGSETKLLRVCKEGEYFGELALINNCGRAATVVTSSHEVVLMKLLAADFHRLMGFCIDTISTKIITYT